MGYSSYVVALIKFVKEREHALTFLSGKLFCKPWVSFKEIEEKQRGDKLELVASKLQTRIHLSTLNRSYSFWLEDGGNRFTPVFCMYHVSSRKRTASIKIQLESDDLKEFGNYGVVVKNTGEFIDRINRSLPGFSHGLIDYINFNKLTEKDRSAFRNPILQKDLNTFGHQQEFRIYNTHYAITNDKIFDDPTKEIILPNEFRATFFSIGDIEDIAEIYSMDELFSGVEVSIQNPISKKKISKKMWWNGTQYQEV